MERFKKVGVIIGIVVILAGIVSFYKFRDEALSKETYEFIKYSSDVIGTHNATSTVGVDFSVAGGSGMSATSTYISKVGGNVEWANYTLKVTSASTTASKILVNIQGSNDDFCDTTATSTTDVACIGDCVLTTDINWFDASDHISGIQNDGSLGATTLTWTNPATSTYESGDEILLTNLNYECLALNISASSTQVYAGLRTK